MEELGLRAPGQCLLEGGHDVWFLNPQEVKARVPLAEHLSWWLGTAPNSDGVLELLYGFFRYFSLEFNLYEEVVSIRLPEARVKKTEHFSSMEDDGEAEGDDAADEAGALEVDGDDVADEAAQDADDAELPAEELGSHGPDSPEEPRADERPPKQTFYAAPAGSAVCGDAGSPGAAGAARTDSPRLPPDSFVGTVRSFSAESGFGFIECEATFETYQRDVFLHQKQLGQCVVGDTVSFCVEVNTKKQPQ
ncbi:unnamed protein product, partial [Prorocentrum cordatum]